MQCLVKLSFPYGNTKLYQLVTNIEASSFYLCQAKCFHGIQDFVEKNVPEERAGFRRSKSTTEELYTLCNIIEHSTEWNATLFMDLVDFEKAFRDRYFEPS